jgi:hypothetical protein
MLAQIYDKRARKSDRLQSVLSLTTVLSGIILLLLSYAILAFPHVPQSVGGAQPDSVGVVRDAAVAWMVQKKRPGDYWYPASAPSPRR